MGSVMLYVSIFFDIYAIDDEAQETVLCNVSAWLAQIEY